MIIVNIKCGNLGGITMRKNYEEITVVELKELCKKRNLKGYSRLKKNDLISLLIADDEKKNMAKNNAKIELGVDFAKAKAFWANINGHKPKAEDLDDVISTWKVMSGFASESVMEGSLVDIATSISGIFNLDYSVENKTDEELSDFINTMINQFKTDTQTEVLHKSGYKIIKASLSDVFVDNGKALFNSANASVFTQDEIKIMREQNGGKIYTMRVVETSENGFSRMLEELGEDVTYLMLYMGDTETSEGTRDHASIIIGKIIGLRFVCFQTYSLSASLTVDLIRVQSVTRCARH